MEGIDIDSIVRKAVAEYRRQEREHTEVTAVQGLRIDVNLLLHRVEVLEREITQRYTDLLNRLERHTHGER